MNRSARVPVVLAVAALVLAVGLAGCSRGKRGAARPPASSPTPTASASESPSPAPSTTAASPTPPGGGPPALPGLDSDLITPDGLGPYQVGARFDWLRGQRLLAEIQDFGGCVFAQGTGRYSQVVLWFVANQLVMVQTDSDGFRTPAGARVGVAIQDLQVMYAPQHGETVRDWMPGADAFLVRAGSERALVFLVLESTERSVAVRGGVRTHAMNANDGPIC